MSQATHGDVAMGPFCSDVLVAITSLLNQQSNPQQTHNPEQGVAQHPKITLLSLLDPDFLVEGIGKREFTAPVDAHCTPYICLKPVVTVFICSFVNYFYLI